MKFSKHTKLNRIGVLPCLAAFILFTSCGGGGAGLPLGDGLDQTTPPVNTPQVPDVGQTPDVIAAPEAPQLGARLLPLGTPMPRVPSDIRGTSSAKATSAVLDYAGSDFLNATGATVDGDSLILQSSEDDLAWAMYRIGGLSGLEVTTFAIQTIPQDPEAYYRVGLSDYGSGVWDFMITSSLPEVEFDLTDTDKQFISSLGNLYYLVVVSGGKSVRILSGHIITVDEDDHFWDDDPYGDEMYFGEIAQIGDGTLRLVGGQTFGFDDETFWLYGEEEAGPEDFQTGDLVVVQAWEEDDGLYAYAVILDEGNWDDGGDDDWDDEWDEYIYFYGEITGLEDGVIAIEGEEAPLSDDVLVILEDGSEGSLDDLEIGMLVEVALMFTGEGEEHFVVVEIFVLGDDFDDGGDGFMYFAGEITDLGEGVIAIDGEPIPLSDDFAVYLPDGTEGSVADLEIGMLVEVAIVLVGEDGFEMVELYIWGDDDESDDDEGDDEDEDDEDDEE